MLGQRPAATRKIYDVSVLIHPGMPIYPGDPAVSFTQPDSISKGDPANVSCVCFGTHTGTHLDAPHHVENAWPPLEDLNLDAAIGPATVFELNVSQAITWKDLEGLRWDGVERVLFKTRNSKLWSEKKKEFDKDFVYISDDGAQFLVQNTKVRLVGIDYLSIEKFGSKNLPAHHELLGRGIIVVEGLDLAKVPPGQYEFIGLPIKLAVGNGAPIRAVLISR